MMAVTSARVRVSRTACDRCYRLKERCERSASTSSCERCERLDQVCLTVRPVRPTGRRSKRRQYAASHTPTNQVLSGIKPVDSVASWLQETPDLNPKEKDLLIFLFGDCRTLLYSVVSPRFKDTEQKSLADPLPDSWPILKDAYLAYAGVLKSLQPGYATDVDNESNLRHVTSAMVILRSLVIKKPEDVEICLTLGFTLALSASAAIGAGISDICQYCLSVTKPFIETATVNPETDSRISFLVLLETMACIVHRRRPTLRIQPRGPCVDRHLGLCVPLLPYFYDLCVISHSIADSTVKRHAPHSDSIQQKLRDIKDGVDKWQPSQPERFVSDFRTAEVVQLLAQARAYRLAALLMVHRLEHTFGQEDVQADIWSREVMAELELARRISGQPLRFVTLPFIIAAVESKSVSERTKVFEGVDEYVDQFTPAIQKATKIFLLRIWQERDLLTNSSWFDSIVKPCVVFDNIEDSFSGLQTNEV